MAVGCLQALPRPQIYNGRAGPGRYDLVIRLGGRWDRHIVPLPFCRLRVEEAEPIRVGPREPLRPLLGRLQAALDDAASRAD